MVVCEYNKKGSKGKFLIFNIPKFLIVSIFTYLMIIPAIILHIFIEIFHIITFILLGIPLVKKRDYFVFDRTLMSQLNFLQKINCLYCSYFNCLMAYSSEIAGRTERFWCPLKEKRKRIGQHSQYKKFIENKNSLNSDWQSLRKFKEFK